MQYLIIATAYVSIYTLVFMSLDRFLAVVYPIESMTLRTESNCRKAIIATWDEGGGGGSGRTDRRYRVTHLI